MRLLRRAVADVEHGRGGDTEDDEEVQMQNYLWTGPQRCVKRCCPWIVRWLKALGYNDMLLVRDKTHLALYLSCTVSLCLTIMWASDVVTGGCLQPQAWEMKSGVGDGDGYRCLYEALGAIIFFGTLCDSVVMIGNYDNQHRELLARKQQLMAELRSEVTTALEKAKKNADDLFKMLLGMHVKQVSQEIEGYFTNVLPRLYKDLVMGKLTVRARQDRDSIKAVTLMLGYTLNEPGQLAVALCRKLAQVYEKMSDTAKDIDHALGVPKGEIAEPEYWRKWRENFHLEGDLRPDQDPIRVPKKLSDSGQQVFLPVQKMVDLIEFFLKSDYFKNDSPHNVDPDSQTIDQLWGCGRPPGTSVFRWCRCCMPRLLAHMFRCFCCCCRCFCRGAFGNWCKKSFDYPKEVDCGCCWFRLASRLHERLIQGLLTSTAYCIIYAWRIRAVIFDHGCDGSVINTVFWSCVFETFRRCWILVALVSHVPALFLCLVRIRNLDAIIQIMEDIRKLEDIRGIVQELERSVCADQERQALVQAIKDRVLSRLSVTNSFRIHLMQKDNEGDTELYREALRSLQGFLEDSARELGPASRWLDLPPEKRQARADKVRRDGEDLSQRNFVRPMSDEQSPPSMLERQESTVSTMSIGSSSASTDATPMRPLRNTASRRSLTPPLQPTLNRERTAARKPTAGVPANAPGRQPLLPPPGRDGP